MSLRRTSTLPDDVQRDLEAIDTALAGGEVDPDLRELAELSLAVRDTRPQPRPGFAALLDERAASGFPPRSPRPARAAHGCGCRPSGWRLRSPRRSWSHCQ